MIPVRVQTLVISQNENPSVVILCSQETDADNINRCIPIWIGPPEAALIGMAIRGVQAERPLPHDLFINAISSLDAYVDHVIITDVKETTFYATLTLRHHGRLVEIDARPSDAIALAIRQNAHIYVMDKVAQKASLPFKLSSATEQEDLEEFHNFVSRLNPDDFLSD